MTRTWYCSECRDDRPFEQPPCPDGHAECPEWICTGCGAALVTGWLVTDAPAAAIPAKRRTAAA